jgi:autotransporter passenger strand-loop-strand repeat protein
MRADGLERQPNCWGEQSAMTTYTVTSGQTVHGLTLNNGDTLYVSVGGVVSGTVVNGGTEMVFAGGVAYATLVNTCTEIVYAGGLASGSVVNSGGGEFVSSGGVDSGTLVNSGGTETVYAGGIAIAAVISNGGAEAVSSGGVARGTMASSGGSVTIYAGGMASGTLLSFEGVQNVSSGGTALATMINNFGDEFVYAGGMASGTVINLGQQIVSVGGLTVGTVLAAGVSFEIVSSGGIASGTVVTNFAIAAINSGGMAKGIILDGGSDSVDSGGMAYGTMVNSGTETVYAGGVASDCVVIGGSQNVSSGGVARFTTVSSGGIQAVYSGGQAIGTLLNGGGSIDFPDLVYTSGGSAVLNTQTDILTVTEGLSSRQLQLTGKYTSDTFQIAQGNALLGGTLVTLSGTVIPEPTVASVTASPSAGDLTTGDFVTLTVVMSNAVAVSGGTPSLSLNDGGTATYDAARSTATALVFDYTVLPSQNTTTLAVIGFNANGATILDATGNSSDFTEVPTTFGGLQVNIPVATVASVSASPSTGDLTTGASVTLTLTMSKAVTVSGGTPSLSLNDGGIATYDATHSTSTALIFDYTVQSGQSVSALAVTAFNANGATIQDTTGNNANFSGASIATFGGLEVNIVSSNTVSTAYTAILRTQPTAALISQTLSQIEAGQVTLAQFESGLINSEQAIYSTLPALVTIDAFYSATPSSILLTTVATATSGTTFYTAAGLHNLGYSDANLWTILAAGWGADPGSNFYALYNGDATGTTAGYTAFINAAYQTEFGAQPAAPNLQDLLGDIPGLAALLSGGGNTATPIQIMGGLYGYLLYVGQTNGIGHYASAADAFLQAAANGTVSYGPELTREFPSTTGTATITASSETLLTANAADPNVINVTRSDQLIDPGTGSFTIQFFAGTSADTIMLDPGGVDQVSGFDPGTDVLDLSSLFSGADLSLTGGASAFSNYLTVVDQGTNALLRFDPTGQGAGSTVAVLQGLGSSVTGLDTLVAEGAIRVA